ncbi:hypothetical protein PRIPAC_96881, partial [Pristionchus pacificus]|uniref:G protein-coupled receptor n=1 Tax=Pristionchus pacificus TaxID=54126 RepID=A0A2A6D356_PRIPA
MIACATCYGLYFAFLTPPILTNSDFNAMFYDPFIGDVPTDVYVNWPHTVNNLLIVLTSAVLYIILIVVLITKQGAMSSEVGRMRMTTNGPSVLIRHSNQNSTLQRSLPDFYTGITDLRLQYRCFASIHIYELFSDVKVPYSVRPYMLADFSWNATIYISAAQQNNQGTFD